jgi:glycosyltransferase involved in cell wall biosynthesis
MNILWVSPFLPALDAPHAGGRALARWIRWTAERHAVTLLCRVEPHERAAAEALRPGLAGLVVQEFRTPAGPLASARIAASYVRLGRAASRMARRGFDLLHVDYLETGLGLARALPVPALVIAIDELARPARHRLRLARGARARAGAWLYWRAIARLQRRVCRKFDRILTLSEHDRQTLLARDPSLPVGVLPFPIGIEPAAAVRASAELLFVGAMHRDANIDAVRWFHDAMLPRVRAAVDSVRLTVVGADPPAEIRALAAQPGVEVTGFVDALEPYYARATVFVAPLRIAGGIAGKTLDALAAGCPVVTTTLGNEAFGATPGEHLLTADTPEDFAAAVVRVLRDPTLQHRLGEGGRAFARARYDPAVSAAALEDEHQRLAASPVTRRPGA